MLLQDREYAVLGSARIDGRAREVAGKRWGQIANQYAVLGSARIDGQACEVAGERREVANQHVLEEVELFVARARPEIIRALRCK